MPYKSLYIYVTSWKSEISFRVEIDWKIFFVIKQNKTNKLKKQKTKKQEKHTKPTGICTVLSLIQIADALFQALICKRLALKFLLCGKMSTLEFCRQEGLYYFSPSSVLLWELVTVLLQADVI